MELVETLDKKRVEMMEVLREIRNLTTDLMGVADGMMKAAADTNPNVGGTKVRKIRYGKRHEEETEPVARVEHYPAPVQKKKRNMKPLSEEQKQRRRDTLVKARAMKGKKK